QRYRQEGFPAYAWTINDEAAVTAPTKPLSECKVSMLTSGGVSHCTMPEWNAYAKNDFRLDVVDPSSNSADFAVNDSYYDTADASIDLNCVFPIDRLRELAAEGVIGGVADRLWSGFMGRIYSRTKIVEESAPALAEELHDDDVDLLLLVPA
ncbi:MAG: glycine/sarcosine/betaine reductase selenoprotein B family protein, partial [Actinomycetota bacterium]|nr:glycine/sarcosine/betaine reductase selenoprotein B family protein [Actinomycetota bacterium]